MECHVYPQVFFSLNKSTSVTCFSDSRWMVSSLSAHLWLLLVSSPRLLANLSDPFVYRSAGGALQYLNFTRADIAFSVNKVAQFMQAPTDKHWSAVKWILRYLKSAIQHGIFLSRHSSVQLTAYTDADWVGSIDDWKIYQWLSCFSWYKSHFLELEEVVHYGTIKH